ncbi:MAG: sigma 54-interacting transcriptional regulator [Clostridiales bacterium]|nr:sigma 54-interacting transcriptional regulator [Clostridiales bacterium]
MDILQSLMESSSHAMFVMDVEGTVTHINKKAKDQFGLFNHCHASHPAGQILPGDMVIIADTSLGVDDGNMVPAELAAIGIRDKKIQPGDAVVAVGLYQTPGVTPVYKYLHGGSPSEPFCLETVCRGLTVRTSVGTEENGETVARAEVNDTVYDITYFLSIAQIVVVDPVTHQVKFWQEKGYSARKESLGDLLRGATFIAKSPEFEIDVVGYHFRDFFEGELFEEHIRQIMTGEAEQYEDMEYEINGYPLLASLLPVKSEKKIEGVIVKFRRIQNMRDIIMERNTAIRSVERKYRESERHSFLDESNAFAALFGNSTAMASVKRRAYKLSQLDCNMLITGESGTGKSFLADAISHAQPRKGPFVTVDCSTITPTLFESEMFGYVGGAFTGANPKGKAGFFEEADGGTIFLDEIGEIPLNIQAKLLNVIQNKVVCRVGSTKMTPVDVRILAATNRNLKQEVATGRFRQDLYYRLSAFSIELPPLRDCREDIYFTIENLMDKIRQTYGMPGKCLSGEAFSKLLSYDWPGNIRELENVLESAVALSDSDIIYAEHIRLEGTPIHMTLRERLKAEEKKILQQALQQNEGNRTQTMQDLGLSKTVFYGKLKEYGIE